MTELPSRWYTDTEPTPTWPLWSRANAGEIYAQPVTPLSGSSLFFTAGELGWRDAYTHALLDASDFDPQPNNLIACFGGYLYLNMSMARLFGVRTPDMTPEMVDLQYFGDLQGIRPYEDEARPGDESEHHTAQITEWINTEVFGSAEVPENAAQRAEILAMVDSRGDLAAMSDAELVARLSMFDDIFRRTFKRHILNSTAVGLGIGTVSGVCEAIGQLDQAMKLIANVGGVDSAAPSYAMWDFSRTVRRDPALTALFDEGVSGLDARLRASGEAAAFVAEFDAFLLEFGSRGPNEWEIRASVWGTHPDIALAAIDRIRQADDDKSPATQAERLSAEREALLGEIRSALEVDPVALGTFEAGLHAATMYAQGRENSKTSCILIMHEVRLAAREIGRRAVAAGHFDSVEQIFMVTLGEMATFIADPASFSGTVREREAQYLLLFDLEPPFIVDGAPPPLSEFPRRDAHEAAAVSAGDVLTGIPGCAGTHTGRARVLLDPSDPGALEPGDILIAPVTDPAWTPLFMPAGAVVVDVGAQITHAVIVSRELGIPCVVSVTDATRRIKDGTLIEVDGGAGTVTILE